MGCVSLLFASPEPFIENGEPVGTEPGWFTHARGAANGTERIEGAIALRCKKGPKSGPFQLHHPINFKSALRRSLRES